MGSFLAGAGGFAMFALFAPILVRSWARTSPVLIHGAVAGAMLAGMTAAGATWVDGFKLWHAAALYGFLVMAYVFAFGAVYKSVSLNLLIELAAGGDQVPSSAIVERISQVFAGRADILLEMGHVRQLAAEFTPTAAGIATARRVGVLQRLFAIEKAGLYDYSHQELVAEDGTPTARP
jgi:hypothetical protein